MDSVHSSHGISTEPSDKNVDADDRGEDMRSAMLLEQFSQLQKETKELEAQLIHQRESHEKHVDEYITRYVNADFWLSQLNAILPTRKVRSYKLGSVPQSSQNIGCDDTVLCSRPMFEPATNLVYKKMHEFAKDAQIRVRQSNDDLLAWKFNPESASGKRMMGRIRQLLSENEKLGQFNHADRIASLEADAELQSTCIKEFIDTHKGIESVLEETYTDIEGLQNSLLIVHQQIDRAEAVVANLQTHLESKRPGRAAELIGALLVQFSDEQTDFDAPKDSTTAAESESDEKLVQQDSEQTISGEIPTVSDS